MRVYCFILCVHLSVCYVLVSERGYIISTAYLHFLFVINFSLFEETLLCYLSNVPWFKDRNGNDVNCTTTDIAPSLTAATQIYYDIVLQTLPPNTTFPQIQHKECEGMY